MTISLEPTVMKHPMTGESIYFYTPQQLEYMESLKPSKSGRRRVDNPYSPVGGRGHRTPVTGAVE